jgi:hypothetical protein
MERHHATPLAGELGPIKQHQIAIEEANVLMVIGKKTKMVIFVFRLSLRSLLSAHLRSCFLGKVWATPEMEIEVTTWT